MIKKDQYLKNEEFSEVLDKNLKSLQVIKPFGKNFYAYLKFASNDSLTAIWAISEHKADKSSIFIISNNCSLFIRRILYISSYYINFFIFFYFLLNFEIIYTMTIYHLSFLP